MRVATSKVTLPSSVSPRRCANRHSLPNGNRPLAAVAIARTMRCLAGSEDLLKEVSVLRFRHRKLVFHVPAPFDRAGKLAMICDSHPVAGIACDEWFQSPV